MRFWTGDDNRLVDSARNVCRPALRQGAPGTRARAFPLARWPDVGADPRAGQAGAAA